MSFKISIAQAGMCLAALLTTTLLALDMCLLSLKMDPRDRDNAHSVCADPYLFTDGSLSQPTGHWSPNPNSYRTRNHCREAWNMDHVAALAKANETGRLPHFLANKTVLLFGDSFERNLVTQLCDFSGVAVMGAALNGTFKTSNFSLGDSRICAIKAGHDTFAAISIFHYGLMGTFEHRPIPGAHWDQGFSPLETNERIAWIPRFLAAVAARAFPELCSSHSVDCIQAHSNDSIASNGTDSSAATAARFFPIPDIVLAQSGIWDLSRIVEDGGSVDEEHFDAFAQEWEPRFRAQVMDPLMNLFSVNATQPSRLNAWNAARNSTLSNASTFKATRFYTRTIPEPTFKSPFASKYKSHPIESMNGIIRKCAFCSRNKTSFTDEGELKSLVSKGTLDGFGILDWDALISRRRHEVHADKHHPNLFGNLAFWQMLLSRLYIMENNTKHQAHVE
ncbi:hypothetical protein CcCBS67573_g06612 [Chytriomyces confervae]|uniref:Uncharacterized protein n=1 Tax=Chytriomyces confervae TaxID=246404 RepID=A0A507F2A4_9FUNG|nr:hypothetical protein CcCBS67573_g06612 [Chytriomyces confervae]